MARPPDGIKHVDRLEGPEPSKRRLRVILETLTGERSVAQACEELGVGEALVSMLQDKGIPAPVQRILVRPPHSRMGEATPDERQAVLKKDVNQKRYVTPIDPRSAHEILLERTAARQKQEQEAELAERAAKAEPKPKSRGRSRNNATEAFFKSVARAAGSSLGASSRCSASADPVSGACGASISLSTASPSGEKVRNTISP